MHHHAAPAEPVGERVVLGLRLRDPEQIVEEQLGGVVRGEPLQSSSGQVGVQRSLGAGARLQSRTRNMGLPI